MKKESFKVRVTESEKRAFHMAADRAGIPMSAWMRERLRRAAIKELESAGEKIPFLQGEKE
jgi:predicted HicB family RNase H-like nuclease